MGKNLRSKTEATASSRHEISSAEKASRFAALKDLRKKLEAKKLRQDKSPEKKIKIESEAESSSEEESSQPTTTSSCRYISPPKKINDFTRGHNRYNAESDDPLAGSSDADDDEDFVVADDEVEYESDSTATGSDSDAKNNNKNKSKQISAKFQKSTGKGSKTKALQKSPTKSSRKRKLEKSSGSDTDRDVETPQLKKKRCGKIVLEDSDDSKPEKNEETTSESESDPEKFLPSDDEIIGRISPEEAKKTRLGRLKHSSSSSDSTTSSDSDSLYVRPEEREKRVSIRTRKRAVLDMGKKEESLGKLIKAREERKKKQQKAKI